MAGDDPKSRPGEFDLIAKLFAPLSKTVPGAFGLTDDAATVPSVPGMDMVLTKDAMVAGVHFLDGDDPEEVARKLLRVNLSDLAAMGANPTGYLLACFWPEDLPLSWIEGFTRGLAEDQAAFEIGLLGGDTVRTSGPLSLSLTALGHVPAGQALRRKGAEIGDLVVVSGTIGDGALGLLAAQGKLTELSLSHQEYLKSRYHLPTPRLQLGPELVGVASACLDVSDGLMADAGHISEVSSVGIVLQASDIPLSAAARAAIDENPDYFNLALTGGDDYELVFTLPPDRDGELEDMVRRSETALTVIGKVESGDRVRIQRPDGSDLNISKVGWQHF
jgi:thiamine-monophosphate kinase